MNVLLLAVMIAFSLAEPPSITTGERWHARELAAKYDAKVEVRLRDNTRVDLLSPTEAIEIDWAPKWAEAIGQATHYGLMTGKQPAIILLLKDPETEWQHLVRAARVCGHAGINIYIERVK